MAKRSKPEYGEINPWLAREVPNGYVLRKCDDNGLLLHWRDWWLEPESVKGGGADMGEAKRRADMIESGGLQACGNCRYWTRIQDGQPRGMCTRYPPQVVQTHPAILQPVEIMGKQQIQMVLPMQSHTVWPETVEGLSCGEHSPALLRAQLSAIDLSQLEHLSEPAEGSA